MKGSAPEVMGRAFRIGGMQHQKKDLSREVKESSEASTSDGCEWLGCRKRVEDAGLSQYIFVMFRVV